MAPSLETTVAGVRLLCCVYNASGPRTGSSAAMVKIGSSKAGGILAKSATLESQKGNPLPRTWHETEKNVASLNSEGLPNSGIEYYIDSVTIKDSVGDSGKPYMVSISGHTLADNLKMLGMIAEAAKKDGLISAVELNLACPNVIGKPIIAYDFDQMDDVLKSVSELDCVKDGSLPPLGVKMPPYFDGPHFAKAADVLNKYKSVVKYSASINTIGNALAVDAAAEMPAVCPKGGFAGLSGSAVKYTALANVRKMRELLDPSIDVVGVGGVSSGTDAFEMILCGAAAVQVGTCHWTEGPKCFDRIADELRGIMEEKGYGSVDDFRGKLKPWSKEGAAVAREAKKKKTKAKEGAEGRAAAGVKSNATKDIGDQFTLVSALLAVGVAILLADKFGIVSI